MIGRQVLVRIDGQSVGQLEERGERAERTVFTYDSDWLARPDALPISLTMPLRAEPYTSRGLHPFFENLLPEGWLLELTTQKLKIPKDDAFGLLAATCADCIGAVEIVAVEVASDNPGKVN